MIQLLKPVRRKVTVRWSGEDAEDYVVELAPEGVKYRKPGERTWMLLPHGRAVLQAASYEADQKRKR
jgi:hypothetical protein